MKQTAVEWYTDALKQWDLCYMESNGKISKDVYESIKISLQEKALEMEKCRMIDFHVNCCEDGYNLESDKLLTEDVKLDIKAHAEQYYNKTFKSE